jgi:hypothetical protein
MLVVKYAKAFREYPSTITNAYSFVSRPSTICRPNSFQSTCAYSPGSVSKRSTAWFSILLRTEAT